MVQAWQLNGPMLLAGFLPSTSQRLLSSSQAQVAMIGPGYSSVVRLLAGMCEPPGSIPGSTEKIAQSQ